MKRRAKNFVRLVALALAMLMLSSCGGCNFAELFNIVLPEETEESGTPITPDGSYTNSEAQSGLVDDDSSEEPTEEVIVQYNAAVERQIQTDYCKEFMKSYVKTPEIQFLGQFGNAYAVYVLDTTMRGRTGAYFVEGYEFRYFAERQVYLYQGGVFTTLQNALAAKIITTYDLAGIHSKFKELNHEDYKILFKGDPNAILENFEEIIVMIQPAFNGKEYTPEDFSEIGCIDIYESEYFTGEPHEIYRSLVLYIEADSEEEVIAYIRQLEEREDIYHAAPAYSAKLDSLPNDSEYVASNNDYWAINKINLPAAWEVQSGNATVLVGIIDTGIDGSHPDLQNRVDLYLSKCFSNAYYESAGLEDVHGHGTEVAGIIGAQANNNIGVFGVCQSVQLVSLRANLSNGNLNYYAIAAAINYAELYGIDIINLSAGVPSEATVVKTAIDNYSGLVICSAGNEGLNIDDGITIHKYYPAEWGQDNVLVVGSSTQNDEIETGTNYGVSSVDLFAPGVNILTTYPLGMQKNCDCGWDHTAYSAGYYHFQHTSAATPFVAGVAALILAQEPTLDPIYAKIRIMTSVDIVSNFEGKCTTSGRLNAFRAVHGACSYTYSYESYTKSFHKAYCECGDFLYERHKGSPSCTKCGYSG